MKREREKKIKKKRRGGERRGCVRERNVREYILKELSRTDEGAAGFVALIYAETGAVYYRYRWMCACVKLETQTSVHANLTRPSASARYSPGPADKEGTLLSSPLTRPFPTPLATPVNRPINRFLSFLASLLPSLLSFRGLNPFRIISGLRRRSWKGNEFNF